MNFGLQAGDVLLRSVLLFVMAQASLLMYAQDDRMVMITHYVFDVFTEGSVVKKNGEINKALLNYNTLTEEIIFQSSGQNLALDRLEDILSVTIQNRTFIPVEKAFYEVLTKGAIPLCVQYRGEIIPPGSETGFGKTQTSAVTNVSDLKRTGMAYGLKLPADFVVETKSVYWLKDGHKFKLVRNAADVRNVFIQKADAVNNYVKANKINFKLKDDLVRLVNFCNLP